MKKIKLLLLFFAATFMTHLTAQVSEKETTMSLGNQNALVIELTNANNKVAENVWKKFSEEYGKVKKNKKAKEFYMEEANIPSISGNSSCDVYIKFEERAGMVNAFFWVDMGDSFLNSEKHDDAYRGAQVLLTEYGYAVEKYIINKELEDEQNNLKGFEKQMNKLVKENKNYHKEIEDAQEKIRKAEINIEQNVIDQTNKTKEIESQMAILKEIESRLNSVGKKEVEKVMEKEEKEEEKNEEKEEDDGGQ